MKNREENIDRGICLEKIVVSFVAKGIKLVVPGFGQEHDRKQGLQFAGIETVNRIIAGKPAPIMGNANLGDIVFFRIQDGEYGTGRHEGDLMFT